MNQLNHYRYYVARAAAARNLAQRAVDPAIAAIHAELADRYELVADQTGQDSEVILAVIQPD